MSASDKIRDLASTDLASMLVQILPEMLKPDSKGIEQATEEFRKISNQESFLPTLTQIMVSNETDLSTRQLAAVLFRRRILKSWKNYPAEMKTLVKAASLEYLYTSDDQVYHHLAEIVAGISEHELSNESGWPELLDLIMNTTKNSDYGIRLKGTELLKLVCMQAAVPLVPSYNSLFEHFGVLLSAPDVQQGNKDSCQNAHANVIEAFSALTPYAEQEHLNNMRALVPRTIQVVQELFQWEENVGVECLGIFSELLELEAVNVVNNDIAKQMTEVSLQISINEEAEEESRAVALSQIQSLIKYKKKAFTKFGLVNPLIEEMQKLIVNDEDPDDGIMSGTDGDRTVYTGALQVLDQLAMNIPAEQIIQKCAPEISKLLSSSNPREIRAGLLILSVIVEGCADLIMMNYINDLVPAVCQHLNSSESLVRSAAYFTLGQFSEHLQPDIADFAESIMPQLMTTLSQGTSSPEFQNRDVLTKIYYALETFVESLGGKPKGIDNYIQPLMQNLLSTLQQNDLSIYVLECVVGSVGAVASAAEKKFNPYLENTIAVLQNFFPSAEAVQKQEEDFEKALENDVNIDDKTVLWGRAIMTLSAIARGVGAEAFSPYAKTTLDLALNLTTNTDDPEIRSNAFCLFGALAHIMKDNLGSQMTQIADILLNALEEEVLDFNGDMSNTDRAAAVANILELSKDGDDTEEDYIDDLENMNIETGPVDCKITALETIGELAEECPATFLPFFEKAFTSAQGVAAMEGALHDEILRAALCACMITSSNLFKASEQANSNEGKAKAIEMVKGIWPEVLRTVKETNERSVCMSLLYHLEKSIQIVGTVVLSEQDVLRGVMEAVHAVLSDSTACQADEEGAGDADEDQAEHDQLLIEYAADILPSSCKAIGGSAFAPVWKEFFPLLLKRASNTKAGTTRSAALGAIADVIKASGEQTACEYGPQLVQPFLSCVSHKETNVRNNAVYGLGVIVSLGVNSCGGEFEAILRQLWTVLQHEKQDAVKDQVLGAVSRMAIAINSCQNVNMKTEPIVDGILQALPVKSDPSELAPVVQCLSGHLAHLNDDQIMAVCKNISSLAEDYGDNFDDVIKTSIVQFLKVAQEQRQSALAMLSAEDHSIIQAALEV